MNFTEFYLEKHGGFPWRAIGEATGLVKKPPYGAMMSTFRSRAPQELQMLQPGAAPSLANTVLNSVAHPSLPLPRVSQFTQSDNGRQLWNSGWDMKRWKEGKDIGLPNRGHLGSTGNAREGWEIESIKWPGAKWVEEAESWLGGNSALHRRVLVPKTAPSQAILESLKALPNPWPKGIDPYNFIHSVKNFHKTDPLHKLDVSKFVQSPGSQLKDYASSAWQRILKMINFQKKADMNFAEFYLTKLAEAEQALYPGGKILPPVPIRPIPGAANQLKPAKEFNTGDPLRQQILKTQQPKVPPLTTGPLQRPVL